MSLRTSTRLALLILALALLLMYSPILYGHTFFWGLPSLQFVPWREYAATAGHLPFWNPYNGAGSPLIANYQSAVFYPFSWLTMLLPTAWSMSMVAVLHLFIAGWGMWAFSGRLGVSAIGRGLSTLAFGLCAYLVARLETYPTVTTASWLPWLMWAADGVLQKRRFQDLAWLSVFSSMMLLAGHAQTGWYSLMMLGSYALWYSLRRKIHYSRLLLIGACVFTGALVAAPQLMPTAELLQLSQRADGVEYTLAMNFSYGPARVLNFLMPNVFGTPADGSYITQGAYFEDAVYIGLIPLVSACAAVIHWLPVRRKKNRPESYRTVPFWIFMTAIAFVFAMGQNTPIFPFLYQNIPTFDSFQAPVRWHLITVFSLSVLAGIGTEAWGRGYWQFFWTRLATAGSIAAVILAAVIAPWFLPAELMANPGVGVLIRAFSITGLLAALAGLLTLTQPENRTGRLYGLWTGAVLIVVAGDLAFAARGLNPTINDDFFEPRVSETTSSAFSRSYWPRDVLDDVKYERFLPFNDYRIVQDDWQEFRTSGLPDLNLLDRMPLLNTFDPLRVGHFQQWSNLIESNPENRDVLLNASGVNAVYDWNGALQPLSQPAARAWFVANICWHLDEQSLVDGVLAPVWVPAMQAHALGTGGCPQPRTTSARVIGFEDQGNTVSISVDVPEEGWLILADTDYPGWTASIDGESAYIYRANLTFRAVQVAAGAKLIRFEYVPQWLLPSIVCTVIGLLAILVLFRLRDHEPQSLNP